MLPSQPTDKKISNYWNNWFSFARDGINKGHPPTKTQSLEAVNPIRIPNVTHGIVNVIGASALGVTLTSNPVIDKGFDGQIISLHGNDDVKTVEIQNGNGVELTGANAVLKGGDVLSLSYNKARLVWRELYRSIL